jgi:hypothetical protein
MQVTPKYAHMRDINRIHFHAERICKAMGAGWSMDPKYSESHWCRRLIGPAGQGLLIALKRGQTSKPWRLGVGGYFPSDKPYDMRDKAASITVSEEKEAEDIVKDINRRYMPEYLEVLAACVVKKASDESYENQKQALLKAAVDAAGDIGGVNKLSPDLLHISSENCELYGDVRATSAHSYEIRLRSVPVKAALAILTILRETQTKE